MGCYFHVVAIFIGIIGSAMTKAGALALFENSAQSETLIVRTACPFK